MTDPTRPENAADDQPTVVTPVEEPTLVTPVATGLPAAGAPLPPSVGAPAPDVLPPTGPVPLAGVAPRPSAWRRGPWMVVGAVVGGFLLLGGAFAAGVGTGYLAGDHRAVDGSRLDELGSPMDERLRERLDERLDDRLERLDRDRDGRAGPGRG